MDVAEAADSFGSILGFGQRRQQHRRQDGDDGDDDQQFNQSERPHWPGHLGFRVPGSFHRTNINYSLNSG